MGESSGLRNIYKSTPLVEAIKIDSPHPWVLVSTRSISRTHTTAYHTMKMREKTLVVNFASGHTGSPNGQPKPSHSMYYPCRPPIYKFSDKKKASPYLTPSLAPHSSPFVRSDSGLEPLVGY
jgi:hypothetical protein